MGNKGPCPMCQQKGVDLTEHHVVEAPDENGKAPSIDLCEECHKLHERYRNYLRDACHIDIDKTKNHQNEIGQSNVSKMQLFMGVMKSLEGDEKRPVEEKTFVKELVKTSKFTEEEARKYIKKLHRESAIYESKPGHYNSD